MTELLYADISQWQPETIDWHAYRQWSDLVAIRSSYGNGFKDAHYQVYRSGAEAAGIRVIHYHYAYPQLNSAMDEAAWQAHVVGDVGDGFLMLDYEENNVRTNAAWALAWLSQQEHNYNGKLPLIYASNSFIQAHLQDNRLSRYPLVLASWQFNPNERPACPVPWTSYIAVQYTDRATNIPGIAGSIDANVWLGAEAEGETNVIININTPSVSDHFTQIDEHHWQSKATSKIIQFALLANYQQEGNRGLCGWDELGDPMSNEIELGAPYAQGSVKQYYRFGVRLWDASTGKVTPLDLYEGPGQDPMVATLNQQITSLEAQLAQSGNSQDAAKLEQIKTIVNL